MPGTFVNFRVFLGGFRAGIQGGFTGEFMLDSWRVSFGTHPGFTGGFIRESYEMQGGTSCRIHAGFTGFMPDLWDSCRICRIHVGFGQDSCKIHARFAGFERD